MRYLTEAPPAALIWDNEDVLRLLIIREELFSRPQKEPSPAKQSEINRHEHNLGLLAPYMEHLLEVYHTDQPPTKGAGHGVHTPGNPPSDDSDISFDLPTARKLFPPKVPISVPRAIMPGPSSPPKKAPRPHPTLQPSSSASSTTDPFKDVAHDPVKAMYGPSVHVFYWETVRQCVRA